MAQVQLDIQVPDAPEVVKTYDRILVFRSPSGKRGTFVEATTPATRLVLRSNELSYTFLDPDGQPDGWYATAYTSTKTGGLSPISLPQQPGGEPALSVLSVAELRELGLFGIPLQSSTGQPMSDRFLAFYIRSAVGYVERRLEMNLTPKVVKAEKHPYNRPRVGSKPMMLSLLRNPAQSVQEVRFQPPGGFPARRIDLRYVSLNTETGLLTIFRQDFVVLASVYPQLLRATPTYAQDMIYDAMEVDYTAGFLPGQVPAEIKECLLMAASLAPLGQLKDQVISPGINSTNVSADGFGESLSSGGAYEQRMADARQQLEQRLMELKNYWRGASLVGT